MAPRRPHERDEPRFVGRAHQRTLLDRFVAGLPDRGSGAAFVTGDAGMGKTLLASTLVQDARDHGVRASWGRASSIGTPIPFRPFLQALAALVRTGYERPAELGPYGAVLGRLVPEWRSDDLLPSDEPLVLAEAVLRLLNHLGADGGALLVLDDLHAADPETLSIVEYLVDNAVGQRYLVCGLLRPEPGPALDLVDRAVQQHQAVRVELDDLAAEDVRLLLADRLDADPAALPAALVDRLRNEAAGNPLYADELARYWVDAGALRLGPVGWELRDRPDEPPATLVRHIAARAAGLSEDATALVRTAALVEDRLTANLLGAASGVPTGRLATALRETEQARLIRADHAPDRDAVIHPLVAQAVRSELGPVACTALAGQLADAIEAAAPDLPASLCQQVAELRVVADQPAAAATLFATAAERVLADGAPASAVLMFTRAYHLGTEAGVDPGERAAVLHRRLRAQLEAGRGDATLATTAEIDALAAAGLDRYEQARLRAVLAEAAITAGLADAAAAEVEAARRLVDDRPDEELRAALDVVAAGIGLVAGAEALGPAEDGVRRAMAVAHQRRQPAIFCTAGYMLGLVVSGRDLAEADRHLHEVVDVAGRHAMPLTRIHALSRLGSHRWMAAGDVEDLRYARAEALRAGAVLAAGTVEAMLALDAVLRADFATADRLVEEISTELARFRHIGVHAYIDAVRAIALAHQGRTAEMDAVIAELHRRGGEQLREHALVLGVAVVFAALLDEDRDRARQTLAELRAEDAQRPSLFLLTGLHGLAPLLDVLADPTVTDTPARHPHAQLRWNRQFSALADAVLCGRRGDPAGADAAFAVAAEAGDLYPTAWHLGLRLVAEEAHRAGWGHPVAWLRQAEDHFTAAGVVPVASAGRALQRQLGARARQRRRGSNQVPAGLREKGVTVREHEVLHLLAGRQSNRDIAARLHLSARTVERHVANLLTKTGLANRIELAHLVEDAPAQM